MLLIRTIGYALAAALVAISLDAATTIKTIYIVPTSHFDRGFVVPPNDVSELAARHIGEVIDVAEGDPNFRWTVESLWQVLAFLDHSRGLGDILPGNQRRIDELMALIRSGRIDLSAVWGSMHTEFMGAEELNRLVYDFARLRRTYSIDSKLAVMNDVPGQPFSLASVLASSGVRYLLVGANQFIGGGTSLSPGNVPFYWQGPDGQRVLTWVSQSPRGGYTEAITDYFLDPFTRDPYTQRSAWSIFNPKLPVPSDLDMMQKGMDILLKRFADAGYRYDAALVMHTHDFLPPSSVTDLERAVSLWNGAHRMPELRIATASEFFRYMEEKYGSVIPTERGEWSGLWSEAKTSSPQISALARIGHDQIPAAEALWSALAVEKEIPFPTGDFYRLYHLLFWYDEHSGAGNVGWPGLNSREMLNEQNREYVEFMKDAAESSGHLVQSGSSMLASSTGHQRSSAPVRTWPLLIWNALSWRRTEIVISGPPEPHSHVVAIRDCRNQQSVPFDIDENGKIVFLARDVPSIGYAVFEVDAAPGDGKPTLIEEPYSAPLENAHFRITMNADGSIGSLFDSAAQRELVNQRASVSFNHLLRSEGDEPAPLPVPFTPQISIERGHILTQLIVRRPGSGFRRTRVRLYRDLDRVEIDNSVDAASLPFASAQGNFDSYSFCFPFALDAASLTVRPEEQFGFLSLPQDYLPGARRDSLTSQHAIALSDARNTIVLAHRQAFHFIFPGYIRTQPSVQKAALPALFTGKWPLPEATLFSRVFRRSNQGDMRFHGITTFPTVEPGLGNEYEFDYAIAAAASSFDPVAAMRFGASFDVPLHAIYIPFAPLPDRSYFSVDQPNIRIDTAKQAETGASTDITPVNLKNVGSVRRFIIRLQEVSGRNTPRAVISLPARVKSAEIVNLAEEKVIEKISTLNPLVISVKPYQTLTVRFEADIPMTRR
ncbi:MAG TPA: hypothetical protein VH325_15040 [Bryobacteraceae bacterium]|jgi:hypothetical protein|nr:hypothetical protein [Bryobacteraceae bacterium]